MLDNLRNERNSSRAAWYRRMFGDIEIVCIHSGNIQKYVTMYARVVFGTTSIIMQTQRRDIYQIGYENVFTIGDTNHMQRVRFTKFTDPNRIFEFRMRDRGCGAAHRGIFRKVIHRANPRVIIQRYRKTRTVILRHFLSFVYSFQSMQTYETTEIKNGVRYMYVSVLRTLYKRCKKIFID